MQPLQRELGHAEEDDDDGDEDAERAAPLAHAPLSIEHLEKGGAVGLLALVARRHISLLANALRHLRARGRAACGALCGRQRRHCLHMHRLVRMHMHMQVRHGEARHSEGMRLEQRGALCSWTLVAACVARPRPYASP